MQKVLLSIAGLALLAATIAGAVGSHVLALDAAGLRSFDTAVDFQFFHGLGIAVIAVAGLHGIGGRAVLVAAWLHVIGMLLFCGSIYARALGAPPGIVAVAPYGGVAFMLGWIWLAVAVWLGERRGARAAS